MKRTVNLLFVVLVLITLSACRNKRDENTIVVGASYVPHAEILEQAKPLLKEKGYTLKIVKYQDYVLPNQNLTEGELDANYFQHIPYLNQYNADQETNIVNVGGVHIEPIGIYSKTYTSLTDVKSGTTVIMSNSVSDKPRLLSLLASETVGLLQLSEADMENLADLSLEDLEEDTTRNPKGLKFRNDIDAGLLVSTYKNEKNVIVLINTNYALDGGLNPEVYSKGGDSLALEEGTTDNPYVNIIAVNSGDEDNPKIIALVEALKSDTIKQYIKDTYKGAIIPAN